MLKLNRFFFDQAISIDNALTTNQIIHQIIKQVKEVVDYVNSLETDAHEYTDAKVLELKNQLEQQISDLETYLKGYTDTKLTEGKAYTDSEISNLRINYIDVKVSEIYATITSLESRLNAKIDLVDATLTNLIGDVRTELIELIKKGNSIIYSGYTGLRTPLADEIYENVYNVWARFFGLTWDKFDNYLSQYTMLYYNGYNGYTNINLYNINDSKLCVGANRINSYSIVKNDGEDTVNITINFSYAQSQDITVAKILDNYITDTDISISVDFKTIVLNNVNIDWLDYNVVYVNLGRFADDVFRSSTKFAISNLNANNKINITWDTLTRLTVYHHMNITYDFINFYFYSDFNKVISTFIKTDGESGALTATLSGVSNNSNAGNYLYANESFGVNNVTFLNDTPLLISDATRNRKDISEV